MWWTTSLNTVTSPTFFVDWDTTSLGDPEQIDAINWMGGPNLTYVWPGGGGDVEYFGNSWAPPEIAVVLVGAGSTGAWAPGPNDSVDIMSIGPAGVGVHTNYKFFDTTNPPGNKIKVKREFMFGGTPFSHDFRPYMPRLHPRTDFTQVLHPNASHTSLEVEAVSNCEFGGSGTPGCLLDLTSSPHSWNGNSLSNDNWFAIHNPVNGTGVIVRRDPTPSISVALWIDQDFGSLSNVSSVLLRQPGGGFTGTVTEVEFLCFYDSSTWPAAMQIALTLPNGC